MPSLAVSTASTCHYYYYYYYYLKWVPADQFKLDKRCEQFRQTESDECLAVRVVVVSLPRLKPAANQFHLTEVIHHVVKQCSRALTQLICHTQTQPFATSATPYLTLALEWAAHLARLLSAEAVSNSIQCSLPMWPRLLNEAFCKPTALTETVLQAVGSVHPWYDNVSS